MTATINISEQELVTRLQNKDSSVLELLYANYSKALYGVIFQIVKDRELGEELLQETFLKIWTKSHQYDPKKARLFTWMLTIARNKAIDATRTVRFKGRSKIQSLDTDVTNDTYSPSIELNTDVIGIRELVKKLNTKYMQVIDLLYFQGYTQAETAEELDLPLGTVKTRIRTAVQLLKDFVS